MDTIYTYTRAQAIEDGVLADITELAKEAGFKYHTVVTAGVYALCENIADKLKGLQDVTGRLWDVLTMAKHAIKTKTPDAANNLYFKVFIENGERNPKLKYHDLYINCGAGDNYEPVLTIMLRGED